MAYLGTGVFKEQEQNVALWRLQVPATGCQSSLANRPTCGGGLPVVSAPARGLVAVAGPTPSHTVSRMFGETLRLATALHCKHEWLSEEFVAESQRLAEGEASKKHHYVPQMYLNRWAVDGLIQPTQVDSRTVHAAQPPKFVAQAKNFYSLPRSSSTMDLPLKWIEKHLSRIEDPCAARLSELEAWGQGVVSDDALKRDLAVFLGLQITRTPSNRERTLVMVNAPISAKRALIEPLGISAADLAEARKKDADPKQRALDLMIKTVRRAAAHALYLREWAVYRTSDPIVTCDDPVILVAGPPVPRFVTAGVVGSAAVLYPINPYQVLVMLRQDLHHRGPYRLDAAETQGINIEVVGAASKTTFERPGDEIAVNICVPPRPARDVPLTDDDVVGLESGAAFEKLLLNMMPPSRWSNLNAGPNWPVARWYRGAR